MTVRWDSQYLKASTSRSWWDSGWGNTTRWLGNSASCTTFYFPNPCCNLWPLLFCVWFVCMSLFPAWNCLYFQSHVPIQLLSRVSGWGTLRERSTAESPCGCLACFHSWFIQIKPCLWCRGASPTCSQMTDFFLESQWRWDTGALYLWTRRRASSQKSQGWFWRARWLLLPRLWGRGWWGGQCWSVYTQAPVPVGGSSLQGPNGTLKISVLLIFKLD